MHAVVFESARLFVCIRYIIVHVFVGSPNCPSGWMENGSRCYRIMTIPKTWFTAEGDCVSQGGHLVSITSDRENSIVYNLRGSSTSQYLDIWIGLNDTTVEGKFGWIDGTGTIISSLNYTMWDTSFGERDSKSFRPNDCVTMGSSGKWRDTPCWWFRPYVCESFAQSASTPVQVATPSTQPASTPASRTDGKENVCSDLYRHNFS